MKDSISGSEGTGSGPQPQLQRELPDPRDLAGETEVPQGRPARALQPLSPRIGPRDRVLLSDETFPRLVLFTWGPGQRQPRHYLCV